MTFNNTNLRYLEYYYLPRIVNQYKIQNGEQDPVSNAANTAIISAISATVTNIFQFIIPRGIPQITTIGTPSFGFLTQNLTLGAFSIVLGVFALGRFNHSLSLLEDCCEENNKVLANSQNWIPLLKENIAEDITQVTQLQSKIDAKNLQFIKDNLICFTLIIGLIITNAIFSSLSLELLAMTTVFAMIGILICFAYNLGNHWDDNLINRKKIEALNVNDIITKLHKINSPEQTEKKATNKEVKFSFDGDRMTIPICSLKSDVPNCAHNIIFEK